MISAGPPLRGSFYQGKIGKVYVTGLGLPSEMAGAIKSGASKSFAIWNHTGFGFGRRAFD
jgi:ABC-type sugar transport system substrate-binding protein